MNLIVLKQWFSTWEYASQGGVSKFPAERELLRPLQHRKCGQKICWQIHLSIQLI